MGWVGEGRGFGQQEPKRISLKTDSTCLLLFDSDHHDLFSHDLKAARAKSKKLIENLFQKMKSSMHQSIEYLKKPRLNTNNKNQRFS